MLEMKTPERRQSGARIALLVTSALGLLVAVAQAQPAKPVVVGTAVCMTCHSSYARLWASMGHSQAMLTDSVPVDKRGCEGCHGPGGEHVGRNRKQIVSWAKLATDEQAKVCLQCHQKQGFSEDAWFDRAHGAVLTCTQCHEVHKPVKRDQLLKPGEGRECEPCHDDLAEKIADKTHHTLVDGALSCTQCHRFHATGEKSLLAAPLDKLCADCHGDETPRPESHKRKDFKLKHKTEAKGKQDQCLMCHDQEAFCNRCHSVKIPHPEDFVEKHDKESKAKPTACLGCHDTDYCGMCHDPLPAPFDKMTKEGGAK